MFVGVKWYISSYTFDIMMTNANNREKYNSPFFYTKILAENIRQDTHISKKNRKDNHDVVIHL